MFLIGHRMIPLVMKFYSRIGCTIGCLTLATNSFNAIPYIRQEIDDNFHTKNSLFHISRSIVEPIIVNFSVCITKSCIYGVGWPLTIGILIKRAHLAYKTSDIAWLSPFLIPSADMEQRVDRKYLNWPLKSEIG